MATMYMDWDAAWTAVDYNSGTDWTSVAIADEADLVSDAISLDGKSACEISITAVEDDTGAINGLLYVYVCRDVDGTNYEDFTADDDNDAPVLGAVITPFRNKTRRRTFTIDASEVSNFKIAVDNDSGQELAVSVYVRYGILTSA